MIEKIILRPASVEDAALLFELRNDPLTRSASLNPKKVEKNEHYKWLDNLMEDRHRNLYIAESEGKPVGTVRSDYKDGAYELSWTVAPFARKKGVGKLMVSTLADRIEQPIFARIKEGNASSIHIAEYCQMTFKKKEKHILLYERSALKDGVKNK